LTQHATFVEVAVVDNTLLFEVPAAYPVIGWMKATLFVLDGYGGRDASQLFLVVVLADAGTPGQYIP
jgi:hypothetical protein